MSRVVERDDAGFFGFFLRASFAWFCRLGTDGPRWGRAEHGEEPVQPFATGPRLGSGSRFEVEGLHPVEGRVAQGQSLDDRPPVADVSLAGTLGIETLEDLLVQVDAEGASWLAFLGVDRAGPAALADRAA